MKNGVQFTEINYGKGAAIIMKTKVFIDGSEGTTGLRINERFEKRDDIELLRISPELRKDPAERKRLIHESDITFLCLPDEAARESVTLAENENTVIIDTSTAHRTEEGWAYGFPELSDRHKPPLSRESGLRFRGAMPPGLSRWYIRWSREGFFRRITR